VRDARFAIEEPDYRDGFEEYYRQWFVPRTLYQFPVHLPFHIPLEPGRCITIGLDDAAITFVFHPLERDSDLGIDPGSIEGQPEAIPVVRSRVEMIYATAEGHENEEAILSEVFDELLAELNVLIVAYIVLHKDVRAHRVSQEMLQFACLWRRVAIDGWSTRTGLFILHHDVPFVARDLDDREALRLIRYQMVVRDERNPFVRSAELHAGAVRQFRDGFYREAVISGQSAIEALLGSLYEEMLKIEGMTEVEAAQEREQRAFMKMVRSDFASRIGGKWDTSRPTSDVGRWFQAAYALRNSIVHGGHHPEYEETSEALDAIHELIGYVTQLVQRHDGRYEALQRYFGTPELPELPES
jgi:hypothetical protein